MRRASGIMKILNSAGMNFSAIRPELAGQQEALQRVALSGAAGKITLLTAAKNAGKNHAEVLKRILQSGFPALAWHEMSARQAGRMR